MSIILNAYPMAFLISPDAKNKISNDKLNLRIERESLKLIKVSTNLKPEDVNLLMSNIDIPYKCVSENYIFENGLKLNWKMYNGHYCAFLSLNNENSLKIRNTNPASYLTKSSEDLFKNFESVLKRNIRDIGSKETFYYCYKTPYKMKDEVLNLLSENKIENIIKQSDLEIRFRFDNKNYKYIRSKKSESFYLELEQDVYLFDIIAGSKSLTSRTLKTNYTDKNILLKTLEEYGAKNINFDSYNLSCEMFGMNFLYSKNFAQGSYDLEISNISDEEKCTKILADLNDEYISNTQDYTYKKILERIKKQNLRIESEEIGEDNSIILTIDVG